MFPAVVVLYVVVLDYALLDYDTDKMFNQNISQPLFSINEKYYETALLKKYTKLFVKDLLKDKDEEFVNEIWWSNAFVFKDGELASYNIKMEDVH